MADNSFEFFPPSTAEGKAKLRATWQELAQAQAALLLLHLRRRRLDARRHARDGDGDPPGRPPGGAAHFLRRLDAPGHRRAARALQGNGIRHLVALRGDLPSGLGASGEFRYASELVAFIRETTGDWFHIEVACYPEYHPQTRYAADEVRNFKKKVDAGANAAITQYFYNADAYFRFVEDCRAAGISIPIVPGVMPIANFSQLARFSDASGAEIPRWMRLKLDGYRDDAASIRAFGLDVVTALCEKLLAGGAPGLHFYTLNQADAERRNLAAPQAVKPLAAAVARRRRAGAVLPRRSCKPLENRLLDTFVRQQAAALAPDPDIVLVNIDEKSLVTMEDERSAPAAFPGRARSTPR